MGEGGKYYDESEKERSKAWVPRAYDGITGWLSVSESYSHGSYRRGPTDNPRPGLGLSQTGGIGPKSNVARLGALVWSPTTKYRRVFVPE